MKMENPHPLVCHDIKEAIRKPDKRHDTNTRTLAICQARNAGNDVTREYLSEGEYVPGTTPATYYYGPDQIGSVRRVFASTSSAPAFSYDPYGVPLQTTTPVTDLNYAGMFYNADSGLDLTQFRAYDPVAGRWLSRDPLGEASNPLGNLYPYVGGDPISGVDPNGACPWCIGAAVGAGAGFAADLTKQLVANGGNLACVNLPELGLSTLGGALVGSGIAEIGAGLGAFDAVLGSEEAAELGTEETAETEGLPASSERFNVTFKTEHAAPHLEGTGLSSNEVEAQIESDLRRQLDLAPENTSVEGAFRGRADINGLTIEYRGYGLGNGNINIGTYFVGR